ncbi:MAG: molybdopterin-guanine dinucleotide biosynthesis protein B [Firmicutes bacterium]|nr:molybdopterin-guanine dinucleotide biosynthesis protein B [Bacillota bacterium]
MIDKPVVSFVGYSNSGKTTLICKILNILCRNYKVAVIKHHGHIGKVNSGNEIKDTNLFLQSGAKEVFLCIGHETPEKIIENLNKRDIDLIILEGFKKLSYPKFYLKRENIKKIDYNLSNLIGVITDNLTDCRLVNICFNIDDIMNIVNFIKFRFLKGE